MNSRLACVVLLFVATKSLAQTSDSLYQEVLDSSSEYSQKYGDDRALTFVYESALEIESRGRRNEAEERRILELSARLLGSFNKSNARGLNTVAAALDLARLGNYEFLLQLLSSSLNTGDALGPPDGNNVKDLYELALDTTESDIRELKAFDERTAEVIQFLTTKGAISAGYIYGTENILGVSIATKLPATTRKIVQLTEGGILSLGSTIDIDEPVSLRDGSIEHCPAIFFAIQRCSDCALVLAEEGADLDVACDVNGSKYTVLEFVDYGADDPDDTAVKARLRALGAN